MSKVIDIENGKVIEINTEVLEVSTKGTIYDLYYHPATEPNSRGISFDKIQLVVEESDGEVRVKPEYEEYYANALDHWLAWRHGAELYYPSTTSESKRTDNPSTDAHSKHADFRDRYAKYLDSWLAWRQGTVDKSVFMTSAGPSPIHVEDSDVNAVNDLIYQICGYVSMNYMKNIRKVPQRFSSEETAFNAFQLAFSKVIRTKVVDGVADSKAINVKALTDATNETITELYYNQAYSKVKGVSKDMVKLVLEESKGKVWVKPEHEKHFMQALELWIAHRYGADFKYSSSDESDIKDQDTADARVLIYQLGSCISMDYMERIGVVPVASAH